MKEIKISDKKNPTDMKKRSIMARCFWCGTRTIVTGTVTNPDAKAPVTYEPCEECLRRMQTMYLLIEVSSQPLNKMQPPIYLDNATHTAYFPTGVSFFVKPEIVQALAPHTLTDVVKDRKFFIDADFSKLLRNIIKQMEDEGQVALPILKGAELDERQMAADAEVLSHKNVTDSAIDKIILREEPTEQTEEKETPQDVKPPEKPKKKTTATKKATTTKKTTAKKSTTTKKKTSTTAKRKVEKKDGDTK